MSLTQLSKNSLTDVTEFHSGAVKNGVINRMLLLKCGTWAMNDSELYGLK